MPARLQLQGKFTNEKVWENNSSHGHMRWSMKGFEFQNLIEIITKLTVRKLLQLFFRNKCEDSWWLPNRQLLSYERASCQKGMGDDHINIKEGHHTVEDTKRDGW